MTLPENTPLLETEKPPLELKKMFPYPSVPAKKTGLNLYIIYIFMFAMLLGASIAFYLSVKSNP